MSLESLPFDLTNDAWVRVYDRIAAGEMPPKKSDQPTLEERSGVLRSLDQSITKSVTARHDQEGRVSLRRLNRREYEASLQDLLGIALPLKGMLPEDSPIRGFDTVSRGLQTSAAHFLAYQRAADRAIDESLPNAPFKSLVKRWTGREYIEQLAPVYRPLVTPFSNIDGDAFALFAQLYGDLSMRTPDPTIPGRYRIRVGVHAVNSGGKPLTMRICKNLDRFQVEKGRHIIDIRNVYPGPSQVFEYEADLLFDESNRFVYFESIDLPSFPEFEKTRGAKGKEPLEQGFSGRGLAFDWAELTGPLDVEAGSKRLFDGLPREPEMPNGDKPPDNWRTWPLIGGEFQKYPVRAKSTNPKADADRLIRAFLPLAFRRPGTEEEAKHYVNFALTVLDQGTPFEEAMRAAYKAILCSPHFLTYPEPPGALDDYAVAARLARFLWSSVPDSELYAAAASKTLTKPEVLRAQTERMLKDPRSKRFSQGFADQWLDLGKFLDMKPDELYVEYDDMLSWSMPMETRKYFDEILANDLSMSTFFHSDWTFLNARLAKHYGIPGIEGEELRKVALKPEYHRGGVVTQASILKLTTNASYTSPIKRGAWIMDRMLGKTPPPPPPDVKAVEPDIRGATTIREQLAKHKNVQVCASCHLKIDPPGFALENYDVIGGWRERYRVKGGDGNEYVELTPRYPGKHTYLAKAVQPDGATEDGQSFQNIDEYKKIILADPEQLARNMVEKLIIYSTGAEIDFADRAVVEQIVRDLKSRNFGFRSAIHAVIQSPLFLHK